QADVAPCASAVLALVDAVAVRYAALVIVLACADPDDRGVLRVDGDRADRIRALSVEDWCPGGPVILRQPHAARGDGDEVVTVGVGEHRDLIDAAGDENGSDGAGAKGREGLRIDGLVGLSAAAAASRGGIVLGEQGRGKTHKERKKPHGG